MVKMKKTIFLLTCMIFGIILVWGINTKPSFAATSKEVAVNGTITLYDNYFGNSTTTKSWFVSDTTILSIVDRSSSGSYCVVKGLRKGTAIVTCVTKYTVKVATSSGFTLETKYHTTAQNVTVVDSIPMKYVYRDPKYKTLSTVSLEAGKTKYVNLYMDEGKKEWKNSNECIVKVLNGDTGLYADFWKIQGVAPGTATLTCKSTTQIVNKAAGKTDVLTTIYTIPVTVLPSATTANTKPTTTADTKPATTTADTKPTTTADTKPTTTADTKPTTTADTKPATTTASKPATTAVKSRIKKITLSTYKKQLKRKKKYRLKVKVVLSSKAKRKITFKSSRPSIASVNQKGLIKAKKKGKTNIIVTVQIKGHRKRAVCKVTVK